MAVITLLTDFGDKDYYVSIFKGDLLTTCPSVQIVDISNSIPSYDIYAAALFLKSTYHHFPKNTIHIIRVFEKGIKHQQLLAMKYKDYYFIAPDNGILTLALEEKPDLMVRIDDLQLKTLDEYYCRVVKEIVFNNNIGSIGKATNDYVVLKDFKPALNNDNIEGQVIYIDSFGNVISNIRKKDIEEYGDDINFRIYYRRKDYIDKFVNNYADVPRGMAMAYFNSVGYLEIGINYGPAAQLLGLKIGSLIKIEII